MHKKTLFILIGLIISLSFIGTVYALEGDNFAQPSSTVIFAKESVDFILTTESGAKSVKVYVDNKLYGEAQLIETAREQKIWKTAVSIEKSGKRKISFKAYSDRGKLLFSFGDTDIIARHTFPQTQRPIVMDCDKVVLLSTPPEDCGQRQVEYGFYLGTDMFDLSQKIKSNAIIRGQMNKLVTGLSADTRYYFRPYVKTSSGIVKGFILSFVTPKEREWTAQNAVFENEADRYNYLFGADTKCYKKESPPFGYAGRKEASAHLVTVKVPIWRKSGNRRVAAEKAFRINYKLANNVKAIFDEIYALDIQFPIMRLYTYQYRTVNGPGLKNSTILSHHSFGAAIDLNKPYNKFYRKKDKRDFKNPYTIPPEVISIFEKYGWDWGGNFVEGFDTMHFQYLGLDLVDD